MAKQLASAPLGLKRGFIDCWLPTFLIIKKDDFALYSDGTYIPFPDGSLYMPDPSIHVGNNISGDMILPTNSITTIAKNTFGGTLIESIVVPTGVTNIGDNAFSGCENLTKIG